MKSLALILPLLFSSPETIISSEPKTEQSVQIVSKVSVCIDPSSWKFGYCIVVTVGVVDVTLLLVDGSPVSLRMWDGAVTYTIWKR